MAQYQDIFKKGEITKKGVRECESRYVLIKKYLSKFKRPFTVLDIGANLGYFSFRIAHDFPQAVCVMIEDHYSEKLLNLCEENNLKNIIFLKQKVNAEHLKTLADCEHFDVVLALNVVHHIGTVTTTMNNIEELGDSIIIETPHYLDEGACGQDNLKDIYERVIQNYLVMGSFSRHTSKHNSLLAMLEKKKEKLNLRYWDAKKPFNEFAKIESTPDNKKYIDNSKSENRDWIAGINLRTFQYLNGIYPRQKEIVSLIEELEYYNHKDFVPWNLIISGSKISMIDINDPNHQLLTDANNQIKKIKEEILSGIIKKTNEYKAGKGLN